MSARLLELSSKSPLPWPPRDREGSSCTKTVGRVRSTAGFPFLSLTLGLWVKLRPLQIRMLKSQPQNLRRGNYLEIRLLPGGMTKLGCRHTRAERSLASYDWSACIKGKYWDGHGHRGNIMWQGRQKSEWCFYKPSNPKMSGNHRSLGERRLEQTCPHGVRRDQRFDPELPASVI